MQQRKYPSASALGRRSGTDGSDFSYRMVVDPRYTKVAQGKSRLYALFLFQACIQLGGVFSAYLLKSDKENPSILAISYPAVGLLSLMIGELGRRRSKVTFLKAYMVASSIGMLLWTADANRNSFSMKVVQDLNNWKTKKSELLKIGQVMFGLLIQIIAISTTVSLIHNMRPPKKAS